MTLLEQAKEAKRLEKIKIENENEQSLLDNDNNEDEIIESNRKNSIDIILTNTIYNTTK